MLLDSLACAMLAMKFPDCVRHLGPLVPRGEIPGGARVPGTSFELDPAQAAFNIGTQVRWLDFNDTWLAAEWGHPSANLGTTLPVAAWPPPTRPSQPTTLEPRPRLCRGQRQTASKSPPATTW